MTELSETTINACLNDLAKRIDPAEEKAIFDSWKAFYEGKISGEFFTPPARKPKPATVQWPDIHINNALEDPRLMVLKELGQCSNILATGGSQILNIRSNYGTGILPSLFGCEQYVMPREMHTLPTAKPLGAGTVAQLIDAGEPELTVGYGQRVFDCVEIMLEWLSGNETLNKNIWIYHPDLQGPIDVAELIWGSEIFYAFYDQPEKIHQLLELVTDTYAAFMKKWHTFVPPRCDGFSAHWGLIIKGELMIRNDSLMNLSPDIYVEFVRHHDQRLFDLFGGGAIHYCGRGDHFIAPMSEMTGLSGINLSQPHLNNMETIYANTIDKGIKLIPLAKDYVDKALNSGRKLHGMVLTG